MPARGRAWLCERNAKFKAAWRLNRDAHAIPIEKRTLRGTNHETRFSAKPGANSGCPAALPSWPTCRGHKEPLNWDILALVISVGACQQDRPGSPHSHAGDSPETRRRLAVDKYGTSGRVRGLSSGGPRCPHGET
jgi:hypothetical protein